MSEIIARIGQFKTIELTIDGTTKILDAEQLSPDDAIYLARSLIACALAIESGDASPGAILADAHIPIRAWAVGTSDLAKQPSLQIGIPYGGELTFVLTKAGCLELGKALTARGRDGNLAPEQVRGTVH